MSAEYTGHVEPGGNAEHRELTAAIISKISVGPMDNNAYLIRCRATGNALLIDAANEADRLKAFIGDTNIATIVTTHQHPDHWQALVETAQHTGASTIAHPEDASGLPLAPNALVTDGDTIAVGELNLEVIHLVGHTPGSIAVLYRDPNGHPHLFTGDSLFPGGPGKTTSPEAFDSLMGDLEKKIFAELPDSTWVYPGHGDDTTLGKERHQLPEWHSRGW